MTDDARRAAINELGWHHYDTTGRGHVEACCGSCYAEAEDGFGVIINGDGCCCHDKRNGPRPAYGAADLKISYLALDGYHSKAYTGDAPIGDAWPATDKYTDDPITVRWTGTEWQEVAT